MGCNHVPPRDHTHRRSTISTGVALTTKIKYNIEQASFNLYLTIYTVKTSQLCIMV